MNKTKKSITYITAACKAAENKLLGKDRIKRMAEAVTEKDALAVLRESSFGGISELSDADAIIKSEERRTLDFAREYAPDESCLDFFLLPYDFYNAEVVVKCSFTGNSVEKYTGEIGLYTVEELTAVASGNNDEVTAALKQKMPYELVNAMFEGMIALKNGGNGVATGTIFKNAEYACLLRVCKHAYLRKMLTEKLDAINVSVCLRSGDYGVAEKQTIRGGSLTEKQMRALCAKSEKEVAEAFKDHALREIALQSVKAAKEFKPLVVLEKEINGGAAKKMYDGRYTEQSGTMPFTAYVLRRLYEVACVRTILSGKTNGLDGERIAERLKSL